ncbi:hypothetical protein HDU98_004854 [Podochytrium sp. JEL0797]|nr:hypothetical protein HDU98_004854 [Podochytrium sp. JEL0797]
MHAIAAILTISAALTGLVASAPLERDATSCRAIQNYMVIVLENEDAQDVLADPYLGGDLASRGYLMTNYNGVAHPSQPNYIAMVSGSTNGCHDDNNININAKSVADLLEAKGLSWKNYAEGYPGGCSLGSGYTTDGLVYRRKHVPFISFTNIQTQATRCAKIVPASQLDQDIASGTLPSYMFYTPDMNNDGHDTNIPTSSAWLQGFLEPLLMNPLFANTLFHIVYDESYTSYVSWMEVQNFYSLFIGAGIKGAGVTDDTPYDHYSGLATVEQIFGLGNLGLNDATANTIPFAC